MDVCLKVLKKSIKSRSDSYSVRNSVLIISHITFWDCRLQNSRKRVNAYEYSVCICTDYISHTIQSVYLSFSLFNSQSSSSPSSSSSLPKSPQFTHSEPAEIISKFDTQARTFCCANTPRLACRTTVLCQQE